MSFSEVTPRHTGRWLIAAVSLYVCLSILVAAPLQGANDRSRWATVYSLVDQGTLYIDEIDQDPAWYTIDKVRHQQAGEEEAHFYSSKPPLLSTMVAGLYWIQKQTFGYSIREHPAVVMRGLLLLINGVPFVAALYAFRRSLFRLQLSDTAVRFLLIVAGAGSLLTPYLTTLNNHTPAATCVIFCLAAMLRIADDHHPTTKDFVVVGLTAALTTCFELPAALFGLISFAFVVWFDRKKTLVGYVPAAVIPLAAFFITNWIFTGGIKPFYAYYGTEKYEYIYEGIPSYWTNPQGLDANDESPPVYAFHCLLGHHGVFSLTPVFLLTIAGWWLCLKKSTSHGLRILVGIGAVLFVAILSFYLTRTQNYNYGGNSAGLRWMLWLTPFLFYAMIPAVREFLKPSRPSKVCWLLLLVSVLSSASAVRQPWKPGWLYKAMESAELIDYRTPAPEYQRQKFALISQLPQQPITASWNRVGSADRLTLSTTGLDSMPDGKKTMLPFTVSLQKNGRTIQAELAIDVQKFQSGARLADWLVSQQGAVPVWAVNLLRGLPSSRKYAADRYEYVQYQQSDGEPWAVKTLKGAARVRVQLADDGECWQRCDVWNSEEAPFGIVGWRIILFEQKISEPLKRSVWRSERFPAIDGP